jgi:uncharacterized protein YjbI with pentapeptide repeats
MMTIKKSFRTMWFGIGILLIAQVVCAADEKEKNAVSLSALSSIKFFKQKLQCLGCDLSNVNLSHYDPAGLLQTPNSVKNCAMDIAIPGANLSRVEMDRAKFIACGQAGGETATPFRKIDFSDVNLNNANLSHSTFYGVDFQNADLSHANLGYTKLSLSNFSKANFTNVDFSYAQSKKEPSQGLGANFKQANFAGANLNDASLYGYFQGADFTGADLKGAVLNSTVAAVPLATQTKKIQSADLWKGVNFTDANLQGAHLLNDHADSDDPKKARKADLSKAIFCRTKMPDGSSSNRNC